MKKSLLDPLICPQCKSSLLLVDAEYDNDEVVSGGLLCSSCSSQYPVIGGIPRFLPDDKYVSNFSLEWKKHNRTQLDSATGLKNSDTIFSKRTGFTDLKGKLVLDAGCGAGRFMEIALQRGGQVIGVDMSFAVDQAQQNVGRHPRANVVQADLMNLPFASGSFDAAFSIGVLHHTSNAEQAFDCVAKLVKRGGKLAVWVYSNDGWRMKVYNAVAAFYRFFTLKLPDRLLYRLCYIAIPLYHIHRIPLIGRVSRILFPTPIKLTPSERVLGAFDWYSAVYQSKHTFVEVLRWFERAGFKGVMRLSVRYEPGDVSVVGVKE